MKRALLIAYCFPPRPVPGALRPGYIAQYAANFGWNVTVLTQPAAIAPPIIPRTPKTAAFRAILRRIKNIVVFPDPEAPWIVPAIYRGLHLMRRDGCDAILSTALPMSSHVVAACLSLLTGKPWIADFRDPWSENAYMGWGPVKRALQKVLELSLMRRAALITTVSPELAGDFSRLHGRDVVAIENGYDAAEWQSVPEKIPERFNLVYTGTMYGGKRNPEILFRALGELSNERHPAAEAAIIDFYGPDNDKVLEDARRLGLEQQVRVHGVVPRAEAMLRQRDSAGLLIFLSMDPATASERGSKYLEYVGARRPMLVFGPADSVMRETVRDAGLGWFANDVESAKGALRELYARYAAGRYESSSDPSVLPSSVALARKFSACLDRVCSQDATGLVEPAPHPGS